MTDEWGNQQDSGKCVQLWIEAGNPIQDGLSLSFSAKSWEDTNRKGSFSSHREQGCSHHLIDMVDKQN